MSFQETNLYLLKHAGAPFTTDRLFFLNVGPKRRHFYNLFYVSFKYIKLLNI